MKKIAIIGSGIGGLTAACLLAKKGHRVTLFESHSSPGGYTAGFWKKGFYFESGTLAYESSGVMDKTLADIGIADQVRRIRKKDRWVSPYFDFEFRTLDDFKTAARTAFPESKAGLDGYFAEIDKLYAVMEPFILKPMPMQFAGLKALRATLPYILAGPKYLRIQKAYKGKTVLDMADTFFPKGTPVHRLFADIGYPEMGMEGLGGFFLTMTKDYWHVADGMQRLADALAAKFQDAGGTLKLRSRVDKILTAGGAAVGIESGGVRFEADVVISACDYKSTFLNLLDDPALVPAAQMEKIRRAEVSEGVFTVYLGLSTPNAELERSMKAYSVNYSPLGGNIDFADPGDADYFAKCGFGLHSLSLINPALAPEGKSSLMIQAMSPYRWQDNWHKGDREAYRALKDKVREVLVGRAEAIVPGLRSAIEFQDAATPLTYERYTGNTDGATSAWSWNPRKKFYEGGMSKMTVATPVRNLLIGSCWVGQIGGIPSAIAAAYLCAKKIG
jgi:phytoene dehydrogenase-like protein